LGGLILAVFLGALSALCSHEIHKMYDKNGVKIPFFNIIISFGLFYSIASGMMDYIVPILFLILILNGARDVILSRIAGYTNRLSSALLCVVYPAVCFGMLFKLSEFHSTLIPILAVLIWITDSFAYFVGMTLGKHRGIFQCSPKKSVEGFIAGFVFAFIASIGVMYIFPSVYTLGHVVILTIAAGIFGQFGDLFESITKRDMQVKDSSSLLPGHGGVLDRFDSLMIAAPVVWFLMNF